MFIRWRQPRDSSPYRSLEHAQPRHKDYVVVNWCLGNTCNYSCTYCPSGLHDASVAWPEYDVVREFCLRAMNHYGQKNLYFEFTGGEVTLWKDLPRLAQFLKSHGCKIGIISNGSRSEDFWRKLVGQIDHVCLSFHPERGNAEHFMKIVELCAAEIRTHVNFMMHPDHFAECTALAYKAKNIDNISIAIQPLVKDFGEELFPYNSVQSKVIDTQNAFLSKQIKHTKQYEYYRGAMDMVFADGRRSTMSPQRFISSRQNSWKGWSCYAGLEQIVINMRGDIFRGWCLVGGKVGHISDPKLQFPRSAVTCNKDFCHCNFDIMTTKVRE
jgi:MoaA/NifB/PqqE/SkfB family radical SAM enzyme